ncbi:hypothetical protein, partial [Vibrio superstes]
GAEAIGYDLEQKTEDRGEKAEAPRGEALTCNQEPDCQLSTRNFQPVIAEVFYRQSLRSEDPR